MFGTDGGVFSFGSAGFYGSVPGAGVHVDNVVAMLPAPTGAGYWLVGATGGVYSSLAPASTARCPGLAGRRQHRGGGRLARRPGVPAGRGSTGGAYAFGDATFAGSLPGDNVHVGDVVGVAATTTGLGYWMTSATGGVFAFGTAAFVKTGSVPGRASRWTTSWPSRPPDRRRLLGGRGHRRALRLRHHVVLWLGARVRARPGHRRGGGRGHLSGRPGGPARLYAGPPGAIEKAAMELLVVGGGRWARALVTGLVARGGMACGVDLWVDPDPARRGSCGRRPPRSRGGGHRGRGPRAGRRRPGPCSRSSRTWPRGCHALAAAGVACGCCRSWPGWPLSG